MTFKDETIRAAIADQAGEWLVANDAGPLDAEDSAALVAWLKSSPVHIEEFLAVSTIARDLKGARTDPEYSLQAILARAQVADDTTVQPIGPSEIKAVNDKTSVRWSTAAVAMAACVVLSLGLLFEWHAKQPAVQPSAPEAITVLRLETRHGEQLSRRLEDNSVVRLNTDSAVSIRFGKMERLVTLTSGQADFEVSHEPDRGFRVIAGPAEVVDLGTKFDVRLEHEAAVVTVVEGRVTVGSSSMGKDLVANPNQVPRSVQLSANQQVRVTEGEGPTAPAAVDPQRTTAWLHRQIVFDHEPLEHVAAEYNRYIQTPIEIVTPALRNLQVSGIFATDDPETFIVFLRSLKGVRVEVTPMQIRVSQG